MRRRVTFTEALVRRAVGAANATTKDGLIMDAGCPGLGLRVRAGGACRYVHLAGGRYRTIGDPALMPLAAARDVCRRYREEPPPRTPLCPTFGDFVAGAWRDQYLARQKPRSRARCEVALRTQLLSAFGTRRLDRISRADCLAWFDRYSAAAPGGANRTLDVLRQIMGAAVRAGHIAHNPTKGITKNRRQRPMRFLTPQEVARLHRTLDRMEAERPGWRARLDIVRLLLLTGCRAGEITGLRWDEVAGEACAGMGSHSMDGGMDDHSMDDHSIDGGMRLMLADSKTGARTVWLGQAASDIIEGMRTHARQRSNQLANQLANQSEYVFPHAKDHSRPITSINWHWRQIRAAAGLDDVRLHDLRHSFASHAVRDGVPLPVVARLLGHANVKMTLRYAHVGDDEVAEAAERVGAAMWKVMGA